MKITAIQIRRLENTGTKLKAIVTIVLDDMIAVHDIKVLQSAEDMFLAMPSRLTKQNTFQDVVHTIHSSVRKLLERLIFDAYEQIEELGHANMEFLLRKDCAETDFYALNLQCYEVGRVGVKAE